MPYGKVFCDRQADEQRLCVELSLCHSRSRFQIIRLSNPNRPEIPWSQLIEIDAPLRRATSPCTTEPTNGIRHRTRSPTLNCRSDSSAVCGSSLKGSATIFRRNTLRFLILAIVRSQCSDSLLDLPLPAVFNARSVNQVILARPMILDRIVSTRKGRYDTRQRALRHMLRHMFQG